MQRRAASNRTGPSWEGALGGCTSEDLEIGESIVIYPSHDAIPLGEGIVALGLHDALEWIRERVAG